MYNILLVNLVVVLTTVTGCHRDTAFEFGVYNTTNGMLSDATVAFSGGRKWDLGVVASGGVAMVSGLPGPVPDAADVAWTDANGAVHKLHVKITPLPPPTATSYDGVCRAIYFVIRQDGTVKMMYHDPHFAG